MGRKTFDKDTRDAVFNAQHGYCRLCPRPIVDFHHKMSNTKSAKQLFPCFIHSVFNCVGLCRGCHDDRKSEIKVTHDEAMMYEQQLKDILEG